MGFAVRSWVLGFVLVLGFVVGEAAAYGEIRTQQQQEHRNAYATMMYMGTPRDYEFYVATRVMIRSLARLHVDADLVVIASVDVPLRWVQTMEEEDGAKVVRVENVNNPYKNQNNFDRRFKLTLNKLYAWSLVEYDRVVMLDADNLFLRKSDELFQCGQFCAVFINPCIFHTGLFVLQITSAHSHEDFLHCLSLSTENSNSTTELIYVPNNSSYSSILRSLIRNKRFDRESTPKPHVIVTPNNASQIQATISCSVKHGMQLRVRSGGHDYEGLSHYSNNPFVIVDLVNIRTVSVDLSDNTAWIQAGAQLGEVYYRIAEKSRTLAFPAGVCPTVGVGGHFSGGGYGTMMRKYGLAADHIIDAHLIDVKGRILDRAAMGEELFWAIRGGGGNTFGVVIAWRVQLVLVPPVVTVFNVTRTLEQNATKLVHQWQYAIRDFDKDLFSRIIISKISTTNSSSKPTILTEFTSLFLGEVDRLLPLMQQSFPELGLVKEDCIEMSWIESTLYFYNFPRNTSLEALLNRANTRSLAYFKGKSDYVKEPIPEEALEGIWERLFQVEEQRSHLQFTAYGGRMDEISESSIPFPHRAGTLFQIHYGLVWGEDGIKEAQWHINWIRRLYAYMGPYVSKNPRSAYVNYRDLDIGINSRGNYTHYKQASIWGKKYFHNNFDRLVRVKSAIDPTNFFRNEQSIPPLSSW